MGDEDVADLFCALWDDYSPTWKLNELASWSGSGGFTDDVNRISTSVRTDGVVADAIDGAWMAFVVCSGIDAGLEAVHPRRGFSAGYPNLARYITRWNTTGNLGQDAPGALVWTFARAPHSDTLDAFFPNLHRIPQHAWDRLHSVRPARPLQLASRVGSGTYPLVVACAPVLDGEHEIEFSQPVPGYFLAVPSRTVDRHDRVSALLATLDASGAHIALLPESTIDDEALEVWRHHCQSNPPSPDNPLTWLAIGTGSIDDRSPNAPGNTGVVIHRVTGENLISFDKQVGFILEPDTAADWNISELVPLTEALHEHLDYGNRWNLLQTDRLRILLAVCEDLDRGDAASGGAGRFAGASHILTSILDAPIHPYRWTARDSRRWLNETGAYTAVCNSKVIESRQATAGALASAETGFALGQLPDVFDYPHAPEIKQANLAIDCVTFTL